ncbi:endonuclease domain-containing protein [Asticcacaulis sp. EMRT-3]|uniref:endonuclease domain-containing protein n=1 Tax=Asticcacaulis sp. EMRT-3 TaxID=3040349 RepID=UPI0024AEB885|nr:endonuclease domain-containing protein [Asticcacaulis sp. EMRT-3]MDI7775230.1 endonuclease domain-containing protein [Asticcacaulis sp. EMRT-3]
MRKGAKIKLARHFRRQMTHAEVLLWIGLKGHSREGFAFRRQHPLGPYIADFYCAKAGLIIEVDGQIHEREDRPQRDHLRDQWVAQQGIETMRIAAADIMADAHDVSEGIVRYVREKLKSRP